MQRKLSRLQIEIDPHLMSRFKGAASLSGLTIKAMLTRLVYSYLKQVEESGIDTHGFLLPDE